MKKKMKGKIKKILLKGEDKMNMGKNGEKKRKIERGEVLCGWKDLKKEDVRKEIFILRNRKI